MMLHFDDIVFGPIVSRRLGCSLGINILPVKGKLCNFDCIYCECGWNKDGLAERTFPTLKDVECALEEKLSTLADEGVRVDSLTFSGNGEPTVHPDFDKIVDVVLKLRDRFCPEAKISVLSNATLVNRDNIFNALRKVDNPIMKIDAPTDQMIEKINKPVGRYRLSEVVEGLRKFKGDFILQTMFLRSDDFETITEKSLQMWMDIVRELKPREVMVYTIDRETPDKSLKKCTVEEMNTFVQPLVNEGFNIQIRG